MSAHVIQFPSSRVARATSKIDPDRLAKHARRMDSRLTELSRRPVAWSIDDARLQELATILAAAMDGADRRLAGGE